MRTFSLLSVLMIILAFCLPQQILAAAEYKSE